MGAWRVGWGEVKGLSGRGNNKETSPNDHIVTSLNLFHSKCKRQVVEIKDFVIWEKKVLWIRRKKPVIVFSKV